MQANVRMTFQPNLVTLPKGKETSKDDNITTDLDAAIQMMSVEDDTFLFAPPPLPPMIGGDASIGSNNRGQHLFWGAESMVCSI